MEMDSSTKSKRLTLLLSYNRMLLNYNWYKRYGMNFMPVIDEVDENLVEEANKNLHEKVAMFSGDSKNEDDSDSTSESDESEEYDDQTDESLDGEAAANSPEDDKAPDSDEENLESEDSKV